MKNKINRSLSKVYSFIEHNQPLDDSLLFILQSESASRSFTLCCLSQIRTHRLIITFVKSTYPLVEIQAKWGYNTMYDKKGTSPVHIQTHSLPESPRRKIRNGQTIGRAIIVIIIIHNSSKREGRFLRLAKSNGFTL